MLTGPFPSVISNHRNRPMMLVDIYFWDQSGQNIPFRGPSGTGDGAHIMTGPIYVEGAEPGDLLKVEILDVKPRYNPEGRAFGSVVIGSWGFQSWVDKSDGETWVAGAPNFDEVRLSARLCLSLLMHPILPYHLFANNIYRGAPSTRSSTKEMGRDMHLHPTSTTGQ